ncbi:MAG: hypothetical protein WCA21_17340 [Terracidiphilus sp.]
MGVGGTGFMHPLDVLLDPLWSGLQADHGREADCGDVVVDGDLGQAAPRVQMAGEADKCGFDRITGSHEAS